MTKSHWMIGASMACGFALTICYTGTADEYRLDPTEDRTSCDYELDIAVWYDEDVWQVKVDD